MKWNTRWKYYVNVVRFNVNVAAGTGHYVAERANKNFYIGETLYDLWADE